MLTLKDGLTIASIPRPRSIWRVVVANTTRAKFLGEIVTLGFATTETQEKATAWFGDEGAGGGIATLSLGYPVAHPVVRGELFVVDMRWYHTPPLVPLATIIQRYEAFQPGTKVVMVLAPEGEDAASAIRGRAKALDEAGEQLKATGPIAQIQQAGRTALSTLKLGFGAVIVGGLAYIVWRTGFLRRGA